MAYSWCFIPEINVLVTVNDDVVDEVVEVLAVGTIMVVDLLSLSIKVKCKKFQLNIF